jgi:hypothetical protein
MIKTSKKPRQELEGQDCYAICSRVIATDNHLERRVILGNGSPFLVSTGHLGLTRSGLVATEVCFDKIKNGIVRVCPYVPPRFNVPIARYVPLDSIVHKEKIRPYDGRLE